MSTMKTTLIGAATFFNNMSLSLFDNLDLPEGLSKQTLVDNILLEGGEFEVLYADPYFLRQQIGTWSDREAMALPFRSMIIRKNSRIISGAGSGQIHLIQILRQILQAQSIQVLQIQLPTM